ncbi:MAG: hypothetical protein E8D41_01355 [Nitrospira sp.]|nr:MAG: hypothetical protein E8D41_01355 [Nitrospira sp.]
MTLHRRLGLILGPAVLLWFLSGVVLLWVPYPSLTEREWLLTAETIQLPHCCAALSRLLERFDGPEGIESVRIRMVGGRPVATSQSLNGTMVSLTADSAETIAPLSRESAQRIAVQIAPGNAVEEMNLIDHDVWTVHQRFDPHRPLWKVQLSGERHSVLYISSVTGDVVQDTTADERRWNLVGAVIHWWYFPWLRRHWAWWDQVVWWVSAIGTVTVAAGGLILGREWVKHGWSGLFVGRWRVHRALGVIAGISACCWMASGWLSMDHGRWFSDGKVNAEDRERFMGGRLIPGDVEAIPDFSTTLADETVKEIRLIKMNGIVHLVARTSPSQQAIWAMTGANESPREAFQDEVVKAAARPLLGDGVLTITRPDEINSGNCLGTDDQTASSFLQVETNSPESKGVLINGWTGAVVEQLDFSRRLYHRLFDGLHRWDVAWLSQHCDVRRILMSLWCLLGAGLAGSGIWVGLRRPHAKVLPR